MSVDEHLHATSLKFFCCIIEYIFHIINSTNELEELNRFKNSNLLLHHKYIRKKCNRNIEFYEKLITLHGINISFFSSRS